MKVIQINTTYNNGSTGRLAYQIHQYLDLHGVENKIAFGLGKSKSDAAYSLYCSPEMHLHSFMSRMLCMQGRMSYYETSRLIGYLKKEKPDIIHLHNIHGHYLNYVMLFTFLKKTGIPVVWTFHDCWPFTGKCAHYSAVSCSKWKEGCSCCPNLKTYPDTIFDASRYNYKLKKKLFNSIDKLFIVCNSEWLKTQVEQSFLMNHYITRIYNGIDTDVFYPRQTDTVHSKYNLDSQKHIILGVSNVWKQAKGLDTFIKLASELDEKYQLIMVGLSFEQIKQIPSNIIGINRTENTDELAEIYSSADLLLNPSLEETFGMVSAEAMACGTPVITSNKTACPEIIDEHTGIVVDMDNINDIKTAIEIICMCGKEKYSEACVNRVGKLYKISNMCKQYYQLYQKILEGKNERD